MNTLETLSLGARRLSLALAFDAYHAARARKAPADRLAYLQRRYSEALVRYVEGKVQS